MSLAEGTYPIGPDTGELRLLTKREGVASMAGHDLVLAMRRWSGLITLESGDPADTRVEVDVDTGSLEVVAGSGGVAPLSDDDRREITANALRILGAEKHPQATFASSHVVAGGDAASMEGTLTLGGATGPVSLDIEQTGPSSYRGTATVLQSSFGIKPFRAFFGALRLRDAVEVEVTVDLPTG